MHLFLRHRRRQGCDYTPTFKGNAQDLAFTNDGKRLVTAEGHGGMVRIWNVETGAEERSFQAVPGCSRNNRT